MSEPEPIGTIEVGDLIQLRSWFGDVWAEVVTAHAPNERGRMFTYVRRDKYGVRSRDELHLGYRDGYSGLSRVRKRDEIDATIAIVSLREHRVNYGALWDGGRRVGRLWRKPPSLRARALKTEDGRTLRLAPEFMIRPFTVSVEGHPPALVFAPTRGQAMAKAWSDYRSVHDVSYKAFMAMAHVVKAPAPPRFGERITVSGSPAFLVADGQHAVRYAYPGDLTIGSTHPLDVSADGLIAG